MNTPANYPADWLEKIRREVTFSITNGLPGAVVTAHLQGQPVLLEAFGKQRLYNEKELMPVPEAMREDTIFDLASLTKIFSTTLAYMYLVDQQRITIDDPVSQYLPTFTGGSKGQVTLRHLLQHRSGMPSSCHFYDPKQVPAAFYSQTRAITCRVLPLVPLLHEPDTVTLYSDLNFALLGLILEKITCVRQDQFVHEHIYEPLGLQYTGYRLLQQGIAKNRFEASERCGNTRDGHVAFPNIRTETVQGEVQDELAFYSMAEVSGHAGLFSTAEELSVLCQLLLNGGTFGAYRLCSPQVVDLFTQTLSKDGSYALGFQVPNANTQALYGLLLPEAGRAVAHTGWTGKCVVIDFTQQSFFLVLTNKKHSPVLVMPNGDLNHFEGDLLPASLYGGPVQLFYAGLISA
jgi:CubicO group peptidase (beta-lactamase class C family)